MAFSAGIERIWIIPMEIAGFGTGVQAGFKALGHSCQILDLSANPLGYKRSEPHSKLARLLINWHKFGTPHGRLFRLSLALLSLPVRILFVLFNFRNGSLVISLFGRSLLGGLDLIYARAVGACVITVFLGSDSRPPYINGVFMNKDDALNLPIIRRATNRTFRIVRRAEKNSDLIICSPSSAHFLQKCFVNWFHIGIPTVHPKENSPYLANHVPNRRTRIVHAPSRPKCKGTQEIVDALSELERHGHDFEFILLHNVSNTVVQEEIAIADLVVDELYSDSFMGGLGGEAANAGVACLTFGFALQELLLWTNGTNAPLTGYADPNYLHAKLTWALTDSTGRRGLGAAQQSFHQSMWAPQDVARRFLQLASGNFPASWLYSPTDVNYLWGFGMKKEILLEGLGAYIHKYGLRGLRLKNKPAFSSKIADMLGENFHSRCD